MIAFVDNRFLVIAVALVASLKFGKMVNISVSIGISFDNDLVGCGALNYACILCNHADTGVNRRFSFDTRTNDCCLCPQKRNGLTLHVGTHQRTVGIVVLQERNHRRSYREHHLRRNVHQIDSLLLELRCLFAETSGNIIVNEVAFIVQRLIRLCYNEVILFISRQIYNLFRNDRVVRVGFIYHAVRRFHKAVLVYSCIGCKGVDKTDVRTLGSLDRAHTAVMCIVNISYLESGTVSGKTARSKSGKTSLMRQLCQRVILIHKLGQLGASEELLYGCRHRLDID